MSRHRVVIIGSGFGGLNAARSLKRADADVTLISKTTTHLFQPLLYQVATGILSEGDIAPTTQADPAQAEERPGVVGRGRRDRSEGEDGHVAPDGHGNGDALRQPHRGRRRAAVLLRQRRLRRLRARHEEHRRRPRAAGSHPRRVSRPPRSPPTRPSASGGSPLSWSGPDPPVSSWPARSSNWPSAPWPGHSGPSRPATAGSSCSTPRRRCCRRWARSWVSSHSVGWKRWMSRFSSTRW